MNQIAPVAEPSITPSDSAGLQLLSDMLALTNPEVAFMVLQTDDGTPYVAFGGLRDNASVVLEPTSDGRWAAVNIPLGPLPVHYAATAGQCALFAASYFGRELLLLASRAEGLLNAFTGG